MGRMTDLERTSKEGLGFTGTVVLVPVPKTQLAAQGLGVNPAVTSTTEDLSKHTIKYMANIRLEDHLFFHEFSRAKLNEIGFRKAESLVDEKISKCCSSEEEAAEMRIARTLVAETLVDAILYRYFRKESEDLRNELDYSFLMTANLRNVERRLGLQGITQAAGYRVSKRQAGLGENAAFGSAVREAFGEGEAAKNYERILATLSRLPQVGGDDGIKKLDDAEIGVIVDCVLELFEIETGKKCTQVP
jgi:hypothetical protein